MSLIINSDTYSNFISNENTDISCEEIKFDKTINNYCICKILSKLNSNMIKKIILDGNENGEIIDLSRFVNLEHLEFGSNLMLKYKIDLSKNINLKVFKFHSAHHNIELDLTKNTNLEILEFGNFSFYSCKLNLLNNVNLQELILPMSFNDDLDLLNCQKLKKIAINKNYKKSIDVNLNNLIEFIIDGKNVINELRENQIHELEKYNQTTKKKQKDEYEKYLQNTSNVEYLKELMKKNKLIENFNYDIEVISNNKYFNNGLEPSIYAKRFKNLLKLKSKGILDERIETLTKPEIELIYFGMLQHFEI